MSTAVLIFPHQLFKQHPALVSGGAVYLVEDSLFFGNDSHWPTAMHSQKLMLHRSSLKAYAAELQAVGITTHYIEAPDHLATDTKQLLEENLPLDLGEIHLADPADDVLTRRIKSFASDRGARLVIYPSPNFITPPDFLEAHLATLLFELRLDGFQKCASLSKESPSLKQKFLLIRGQG